MAGTIFLGGGFAAKYRQGGGNFSVPLQWALGLQSLRADFVWLELLPAGKEGPAHDRACLRTFADRMRQHGLADRWCVLLQDPAADAHDLGAMRCFGKTRTEIEARLGGPNVLLNLSYSLHPPLLPRFERRILCDLDPTEFAYWMSTGMEMGQGHHHEFWTIGLNMGQPGCGLPTNGLPWKTFFPLVDLTLNRPAPPPRRPRFTTIGQWYWANNIPVDGAYPDLSKGAKFQRFLDLPGRVGGAEMELAMNFAIDDPARAQLLAHGWRLADPHAVAASPFAYRRYLRAASGEFTTIKGVDSLWRSGWLSDRAAAFLATGRPVVTEDAGVGQHLPAGSPFFEVNDAEAAAEALNRVVRDGATLSRSARACAEECFDAGRTLRRILGG